MAGRHRRRKASPWRRIFQAVAAGSAAAMLGAVIGIVRREAAIPDVVPPKMELELAQTTVTMPAIPVEAPASAAEAARSAAATTPPPPVTTTPRPAARETPGVSRAPAAEAVPVDGSVGERAVAAARTYFGIPYVWGGTSRAGLDCSGLVYLVFKGLGYSPPRTAATQANWARRIPASQARPGDLVFKNVPATHVGIYIGNGRMIDAATFGTVVAERPVMSGAYYGRVT